MRLSIGIFFTGIFAEFPGHVQGLALTTNGESAVNWGGRSRGGVIDTGHMAVAQATKELQKMVADSATGSEIKAQGEKIKGLTDSLDHFRNSDVNLERKGLSSEERMVRVIGKGQNALLKAQTEKDRMEAQRDLLIKQGEDHKVHTKNAEIREKESEIFGLKDSITALSDDRWVGRLDDAWWATHQ